jgi:hypothetical protein
MGRPRKSGKRLTVRLELDNYQQLNDLAQSAGESDINRVLNETIRAGISAPLTANPAE